MVHDRRRRDFSAASSLLKRAWRGREGGWRAGETRGRVSAARVVITHGSGGPDLPARIYEVDAVTGGASLLGVIGGGGWDASSIAIVNIPAGVPGDVNGDGDVDFEDLLALLADWGACPAPPGPCPADLDGNGIVDFDDLLVVLGGFGG